MDADSFSSGQDALSKSPAPPHASAGVSPPSTNSGVPFSLVSFLLGKQEKVTRPSADGRNARRAGEQPGDNTQQKAKVTGFQLSLE